MSFRKVDNRTRDSSNGHDNRTVRFDSGRGRGTSFKHRSHKNPFSSRTRRSNDGDVNMNENDGASNKRAPYRGVRRGNLTYHRPTRGGSRGRGGYNSEIVRSLVNNNRLGPSDWYKITVVHGKRNEKNELLRSLSGLMNNVPFVPFHYQFEGQNAVFFVNDQATALAVRDCSKKIVAANGFKLMILAKPCATPYVQIDEALIEKLKVTMSSRYDPSTKFLNMSSFHSDESLKEQGLHLTLTKYSVVKEVLNIIENFIPEVESLDISNNTLFSLDSMKRLPQIAKSLTKVSVGKNVIKSEHDLDALKKLPLEQLVLDGNPLCDKFKDEVSYVR